MPSTREAAVLALVEAAQTTGALVWRATDVEQTVPLEGLIEIAEGDDAIEAILSPLAYAHELAVDVTVTVTRPDEPERDAALDALLQALADAVTADRTLGGAVEFAEIGAPAFLAFEGDGAGKSAHLQVTLSFTTAGSPLA